MGMISFFTLCPYLIKLGIPANEIPNSEEAIYDKFPREVKDIENIIMEYEMLMTGKKLTDKTIVNQVLSRKTITVEEHEKQLSQVTQNYEQVISQLKEENLLLKRRIYEWGVNQ